MKIVNVDVSEVMKTTVETNNLETISRRKICLNFVPFPTQLPYVGISHIFGVINAGHRYFALADEMVVVDVIRQATGLWKKQASQPKKENSHMTYHVNRNESLDITARS